MKTVQGATAPRSIAYCHWHNGLSDTARPVQTGAAGILFACAKCQVKHALTAIGDQP